MLNITLNIFDPPKEDRIVTPKPNKATSLSAAETKKNDAKKAKKFSYRSGDFNPTKKDSYYAERAFMVGT